MKVALIPPLNQVKTARQAGECSNVKIVTFRTPHKNVMSWLCLVCTSGAVGRAVERLEGTLGRARDHLDGMDARRDRIARALKEANEAATTRLLEAINAGEAARHLVRKRPRRPALR